MKIDDLKPLCGTFRNCTPEYNTMVKSHVIVLLRTHKILPWPKTSRKQYPMPTAHHSIVGVSSPCLSNHSQNWTYILSIVPPSQNTPCLYSTFPIPLYSDYRVRYITICKIYHVLYSFWCQGLGGLMVGHHPWLQQSYRSIECIETPIIS